jgi:hypothetical protein
VEHLQGRKQPEHLGIFGMCGVCDGTPAPVGERRAEPLAASQHEVFEGGGQRGVFRADVGGVPPSPGQVLAKLAGDGAGQLQG